MTKRNILLTAFLLITAWTILPVNRCVASSPDALWEVTGAIPIDPLEHEVIPDTVKPTPVELAQQQLNAYNARDIEAFLEPYAEDVELFNFPNQPISVGKERMRRSYGKLFEETPDLHCELVDRMVMGNTVIDQERVVFRKGEPALNAIAIYKIKDGKIARVYFITE